MTTLDQMLDDLRLGVDDQTWVVYVQQLQEQGAEVCDGVSTASGAQTAEIHFGWLSAHHVRRDAAGRWFLVSPVPGTSARP